MPFGLAGSVGTKLDAYEIRRIEATHTGRCADPNERQSCRPRHGMRTTTRAALNEGPAPEAAAKVWDDYLHLFGTSAYVWARYASALAPPPVTEDATGTADAEPSERHRRPRSAATG
jgi:hypothetical protein